jgi:hypothetical protein
MGASVIAYWPGITEEQIEEQPGFYNDCKAWGNWMAEREQYPDVLQSLKDLEVAPILTFTTDGIDDADVEWVTPEELRNAAKKLREVVESSRPGVDHILETYQRNANDIDPVADEFMRDLEDIEALAQWAEDQGAIKMTLQVNW